MAGDDAEGQVVESLAVPSSTRRMLGFSRAERQKVMSAAAETLAEYYRPDPEMRDWQALDGEPFDEEQ